MARTMPPMMQVMKEIGGVELPESLIKFTEEAEKVKASDNGDASVTRASESVI
jgi:flotillin